MSVKPLAVKGVYVEDAKIMPKIHKSRGWPGTKKTLII
jgi:hypothetical protein